MQVCPITSAAETVARTVAAAVGGEGAAPWGPACAQPTQGGKQRRRTNDIPLGAASLVVPGMFDLIIVFYLPHLRIPSLEACDY